MQTSKLETNKNATWKIAIFDQCLAISRTHGTLIENRVWSIITGYFRWSLKVISALKTYPEQTAWKIQHANCKCQKAQPMWMWTSISTFALDWKTQKLFRIIRGHVSCKSVDITTDNVSITVNRIQALLSITLKSLLLIVIYQISSIPMTTSKVISSIATFAKPIMSQKYSIYYQVLIN